MKIVIKNSENYILKSVEVTRGALLSAVLKRESIYLDLPCGGMGRCGKCKVLFTKGAPSATDADRRSFDEEELNAGYRLACRAVVISDAEIELTEMTLNNPTQENQGKKLNSSVLENSEETLSNPKKESLAQSSNKIILNNPDKNNDHNNKEEICEKYGVAIDIGTTTIVVAQIALDNIESANTPHNTDRVYESKNSDSIYKSNNPDSNNGTQNKDNADNSTGTISTVKEDFVKKSIINSQRVYGADVISRIKAANDGHAADLRDLVFRDIANLLPEKNKIEKIILAGNTTMIHILMGDSCKGLGTYPYTPVRLTYPDTTIGENTSAQIFEGISAFVGADIVSGMYALGFGSIPQGKTYMLIDLGTNGEMAVGDSEKITVCSTAAGPVFEGGGISCGMAGIPGAIEHVKIEKTLPHSITDAKESKVLSDASANPRAEDTKKASSPKVEITVIGDQNPVGLCGSGVLETVSELRRCEIIDETGLLSDTYFEEGFPIVEETDSDNFEQHKNKISFTQSDIRAVQLAKAAIRSGIDTLLASHGCRAEDIDRVYLAGGFSEHLDLDKVRYLKMLPGEFFRDGVLISAGNTSLKGCIRAFSDSDYKSVVAEITGKATEIPLAAEDTFSDSFIEAMNF